MDHLATGYVLDSVLPDLAVLFSGRFPYTLLFDEDGYREFRYLAGAIVMATVIVQELMLLEAAQGMGIVTLAGEVRAALDRLSTRVIGIPRAARGRVWSWLPLAVVMVAGIVLRNRLCEYVSPAATWM